MNVVHHADNTVILPQLETESIDLVYIDPPFNTGRLQEMNRVRTIASNNGDRTGFNDKRYETTKVSQYKYQDAFDTYVDWLMPTLQEIKRLLKSNGSLFVHLDYREVHYVKIALDGLFGRYNMLNEIIWAYDYGGRGKKKWPTKHDTILWYVKNLDDYTFNYNTIDRIPYMAPSLVTKEKAEKGKVPTDVWWNTIVPTNGKERTGYPTQKPRAIIDRIIKVHSNTGDTILDCFAGSGTTGESAYIHNRKFILIDDNEEAVQVMKQRFSHIKDIVYAK